MTSMIMITGEILEMQSKDCRMAEPAKEKKDRSERPEVDYSE